MENKIKEILFEKIKDMNTAFVFPSQIACERWAEYVIENSDVKAVAMERFIPWDVFKENAIRSTRKDKKSVPSVMRRFFAVDLLSKNAKSPFLKEIVSPNYASSSSGFTDWITNLIPALSMWKKFFESSGVAPDKEDEDFLEIYERYKAFLDSYDLFDPAWETPPFHGDGRNFILFYPEILSDWFEYESLLRSSDFIQIVSCDEKFKERLREKNVFFFPDSRSEIKSAVRYIRSVHEKDGIPWDNIALSVPDMENYGPYVERELSLFQIPFASKCARPLSSFAAGGFFTSLKELYSSDFSYDGVKNLLLNTELPWKDTEARDQLVLFGKENNCIVNFLADGKKIDVWEKSFASRPNEERALTFYKKLKKSVTAIVMSKSFSDVRASYFAFKDDFFDMEKCSKKTDEVLGRCLTELSLLVELEKTYSECKVPSPFSFFVSYLDEKSYLSQSKSRGVQVIPYRLSGTAPYALQVVLDASQASMSVIYRALSFLREDKRKQILSAVDFNAGDHFIALYNENSLSKDAWFSCASKTFSGYSQPVSVLKEVPFEEALSSSQVQLCEDFYKEEKKWFSEDGDFPFRVTDLSRNSNKKWCENFSMSDCEPGETAGAAAGNGSNGSPSGEAGGYSSGAGSSSSSDQRSGKIRVSYSKLKKFLSCPRMFYLSSVVHLQEESNEAELIDRWEMGTIYHKVFEEYLFSLKKKDLPLKCQKNEDDEVTIPPEYEEIFTSAVENAINSRLDEVSFTAHSVLSAMKKAIYEKMRSVVTSFSYTFLDYKVYAVEKPLVVETEHFMAEGRIDAILVSPTDCDKVIVDFKTSSVPDELYFDGEAFNESGALPDFQMPMYFYLLENQERPETASAACYYKISSQECVPVAGEIEGFTKKGKPMEEYRETIDVFTNQLEGFVRALEESNFSTEGKKLSWSTCYECDYRAFCRRVFNVGKAFEAEKENFSDNSGNENGERGE